jgi:hypothetical protein
MSVGSVTSGSGAQSKLSKISGSGFQERKFSSDPIGKHGQISSLADEEHYGIGEVDEEEEDSELKRAERLERLGR